MTTNIEKESSKILNAIKSGNLHDAIALYETISYMDDLAFPEMSEVNYVNSQILLELGEVDSALYSMKPIIENINKLSNIIKKFEYATANASLLIYSGRMEDAMKALHQSKDIMDHMKEIDLKNSEETLAKYFNCQGLLLLERSETDESMREFDKALAIFKGFLCCQTFLPIAIPTAFPIP